MIALEGGPRRVGGCNSHCRIPARTRTTGSKLSVEQVGTLRLNSGLLSINLAPKLANPRLQTTKLGKGCPTFGLCPLRESVVERTEWLCSALQQWHYLSKRGRERRAGWRKSCRSRGSQGWGSGTVPRRVTRSARSHCLLHRCRRRSLRVGFLSFRWRGPRGATWREQLRNGATRRAIRPHGSTNSQGHSNGATTRCPCAVVAPAGGGRRRRESLGACRRATTLRRAWSKRHTGQVAYVAPMVPHQQAMPWLLSGPLHLLGALLVQVGCLESLEFGAKSTQQWRQI